MAIHERSTLSNKIHVFSDIFKEFTDDATVLDFGGNQGNLLYFSNGAIKEHNYTCIDVSLAAIHKGNREFPKSNWIYYNKYNWAYNHAGNVNESFPRIFKKQDFIWAYSVFTHTDFDELKNTIEWFYSLNPINGAISILDINNKNIVDYFTEKRIDEYGECTDLNQYKNCDIIYFGNNDSIIANTEKLPPNNFSHFLSFYNLDWLEQQLKSHFPSIHIKYLPNNFSPFIILK